MVGTRRFLQ